MMSLPVSNGRAGGAACAALSAAVAILGLTGLELVALARAGWVFDYPLDDVYIHLSMAESILEGGYGINPGEPASAASSILYPLLLLPLFGAKLQLWMPLIWNFLAVTASGALWGAGIARAGLGRGVSVLLALLGPLALNLAGVGFTGMENSLHVAAALATVLGLWIFLTEGRIGALLVLGTFFAPLFRLEGLALSGLACALLVLRGRAGAGIALGLATLVPVAGFMAVLQALGLPPLPGSVMAKVGFSGQGLHGIDRVVFSIMRNLMTLPGQILAVTTLLCLFLPALMRELRDPRGALLAVLGVAGLAHLLGGQIGWMHRYEIYIVSAQFLGLILVLGNFLGNRSGALQAAFGMGLLVAALGYAPDLIGRYQWNPRAIHLQQAQMARFAKEWWKAPVAVNDLGRVAWQNPDYVLDLYGLGSAQVLQRRLAGQPASDWAGPLMARHGVELAMIYDSWLKAAVGADWIRLGQLQLPDRHAWLGDYTVSFYTTNAAAAARARSLLTDFVTTLPEGAVWVWS